MVKSMFNRSPSETHSHLEKEFAFQNDGFITKLLKPELPCTPVIGDGPIRNIGVRI